MSDEKSAFDMSRALVRLYRGGTSEVAVNPRGPHGAIDGFVIGAPSMSRNPPHGGERHPDGDELLYLLSGRVDVVLEEPNGERRVELEPGMALIVPKGVWHRVLVRQPIQLLHVTPGPSEEHRPLKR